MAGYCVIKYAYQAEPSRVVNCPDGHNVVGCFFVSGIIAQVISYCVKQYYHQATLVVRTQTPKRLRKCICFRPLAQINIFVQIQDIWHYYQTSFLCYTKLLSGDNPAEFLCCHPQTSSLIKTIYKKPLFALFR